MVGECARERGNIGIWAALAFTAVGGFMALAVHAGRSYSNRVELQNGADAAALAAAAQLDGTQAGVDAATQAAEAFGARHRTENVRIAVGAADVTLGTWDRSTATFSPIAGRTAADLRQIIAVRVGDARTDLSVPFGPAFLRASTTTSVGASAVAVGGGPCEDSCAFPGAFADCMMFNADGTLRCDDKFYVLNNDWQDNLGLTSLDPSKAASVPNIKAALNDCVHTSADTPVPVSNGNPVQPVFTPTPTFPLVTIAPVVHPSSCQSAYYEKCAASGGPNSPCTNAKFVGDLPIVGYVSIVLCYVTKSTVKDWPPSDWGPSGSSTPEQVALWDECGPPPTQRDFPGVPDNEWPSPFLKQTIFLKNRCHWIDPGNRSHKAGCQSFGIWTSRSRLVQ
jgi:Flp pilus assembly protein TadG